MSLEPKKEPSATPPETEEVSKTEQAAKLAMTKYKDLPDDQKLVKVMEDLNIAKSTGYRALRMARRRLAKETLPPAERKAAPPSIEVTGEQREKPPYLPDEERPRRPLAEEEIEEVRPIPAEELPDFFRDSLRGTYCLLLSDDGILGKKYGRPKEQVVLCSDSLYRWFSKRIPAADLEKYDTILLIINHLTLIGGIAKPYLDDRRKQEAKKTD